MKPSNLKFFYIHVGKCAGSSLFEYLSAGFSERGMRLIIQHKKRFDLSQNDELNRYLVVVRNPIERYVSAFNHSKNLVDFDISNIKNPDELNINNCLAPFHIKNKIKNKGIVFSNEYDDLINYFKNANDLAESLSTKKTERRLKAIKLFNHPHEHIFKGIGWYLHNGDFVKKNHSKIIFAGRLEYIKHDMESFLANNNLGFIFEECQLKKYRVNSKDYSKFLSKKALENIISWYYKTDFKSIKTLCEYDLIPESYYSECFEYRVN
tara:strand:- start:1987 stop:2781 length:795 start_codon:yes stop_codon:yes gene_type:complete